MTDDSAAQTQAWHDRHMLTLRYIDIVVSFVRAQTQAWHDRHMLTLRYVDIVESFVRESGRAGVTLDSIC